jgi:hypothetical protein
MREEDGSEAPAAEDRSAADGTFHLSLPAGSYDLYALSPAGAFALGDTDARGRCIMRLEPMRSA